MSSLIIMLDKGRKQDAGDTRLDVMAGKADFTTTRWAKSSGTTALSALSFQNINGGGVLAAGGGLWDVNIVAGKTYTIILSVATVSPDFNLWACLPGNLFDRTLISNIATPGDYEFQWTVVGTKTGLLFRQGSVGTYTITLTKLEVRENI